MTKLRDTCFVNYIRFQTRMANPTLVNKFNEKCPLCVYFWDINKACPKNAPRIDQLVQATSEHMMLCLMDAYFDYNKIRMYPTDVAYTVFYPVNDILNYKALSIRLVNVGLPIKGWSTISSRI